MPLRRRSPGKKAWETRRKEFEWRHEVGKEAGRRKKERELAARSLLIKWKKECVGRVERCVVCAESMPNTLDTHHLDGNDNNNDPENLVTLCASCHRIFDKAKSSGEVLRDFKKRH